MGRSLKPHGEDHVDGAMMDGTNFTLLLVRWVLRSKFLLECVVNSPHLRNPENLCRGSFEIKPALRFKWLADRVCV